MIDLRINYPFVEAPFMHTIRTASSHAEACDWLQKQWNETQYLRAKLREISDICERLGVRQPTAP